MTLQELEKGTDVNLDICFADQSIEIPSRVVGTNENGALILPYVYQGHMIDFGMFKQRGAFFDLYCNDQNTNIRNVFKNVNVSVVEYKNVCYYCISVRAMNSISYESDRRGDTRVPLKGIGYINVENDYGGSKHISVEMQDISEKGIAFLAQEIEEIPTGEFIVNLDTLTNDSSFHLNLHVRVVRRVEKPGWTLYGCKFVHLDKDTLAYLYLRHVEMNRKNRL